MPEAIRVPPTPALRRFSEQRGFSAELVARWGEFYPDLQGLLAAMDRPQATFIRMNALRSRPDQTRRSMAHKGFVLEPASLPGAFQIREAPFSAGATLEYLQGRYFLQDLSSQLAPLALDPRPGEDVADLCAAPGGKTVALADLMRNEGRIAAFELQEARHATLRSNLSRCGVWNTASWGRPGQSVSRLAEQFDRILLDAPCTGEGVVARDPRRKRGQLQEYEACAREQGELVDAAWRALRPGGILLYATCTLAPEENEIQVHEALTSGRFEAVDLPPTVREARLDGKPLFPGLSRIQGRELDPGVRKSAHVLPHLHGCLGFFVAKLRKVIR